MLGIHTKQINSYGKRSRRIVQVSSGLTSSTNSIFDDIPPAPKLTNLASKMKKRENSVPKSRTPSPKAVAQQRKKVASGSPVRRPKLATTAQIRASKMNAKLRSLSGSKDHPIVLSGTPSRALLSGVPFNVPASPAIAEMKVGTTPARGSMPKHKKPFIPYVDVEIITLDENGKTVHKERRVSKTGVEMNHINSINVDKAVRKPYSSPEKPISISPSPESGTQPMRNARRNAKQSIIISSDESDVEPVFPRRATSKRAKQTIILSSDESDVDDVPPQLQEVSPLKPAKPVVQPPSGLKVEVVIPPAPYPIHSRPRLGSNETSHPSEPLISDRLQRVPSPIPKPRQLTPIRGGARNRLLGPPSPPSPTTPTDFDFSIDFEDLNIGSEHTHPLDFAVDSARSEYLIPLLEECGQQTCGPYEFSAFIESFPYDPIFGSRGKHLDMKFRKIGEASYSEVFGIGDVVLKVIPLRNEEDGTAFASGSGGGVDIEDDGPAPTDAKDVRKEIIVTRAMCDVYDGFVELLKTYVVRGRYPEVLLRLWDEYNEQKGSESIRPDTFKVSQLYTIIVLPNGGPDLEAYSFAHPGKNGWRQACSLFWQVAKSLAHAERLVSFEHRDLHWGQILVKNLPATSQPLRSLDVNHTTKQAEHTYMDDPSHGVRVTIIDLGLSRMDAGDGGEGARVHWTPFDEEIFHGEGDYQFDIYRMMRDVIDGSWEDFQPFTNVMWLHYLTCKLLKSKGLKSPSARKSKVISEAVAALRTYSEKDCYECLVDINDWLGQAISRTLEAKVVKAGKGRKKIQLTKAFPGPACAGEVVEYAVKKGWVKPIL